MSVVFIEDLRDSTNKDSMERADFLKHVQSVHDKRLGTQRGWDRWLDNHLGLMYQGVHLDDIAPTLVENGVGFRAYRDTYKMDSACEASINEAFCGSLWCGGHSGLGVEFHSFFDKDRKFFNGDFAPTCKLISIGCFLSSSSSSSLPHKREFLVTCGIQI